MVKTFSVAGAGIVYGPLMEQAPFPDHIPHIVIPIYISPLLDRMEQKWFLYLLNLFGAAGWFGCGLSRGVYTKVVSIDKHSTVPALSLHR
jgi:hypothetical protein